MPDFDDMRDFIISGIHAETWENKRFLLDLVNMVDDINVVSMRLAEQFINLHAKAVHTAEVAAANKKALGGV